jgi:hypothetical protein
MFTVSLVILHYFKYYAVELMSTGTDTEYFKFDFVFVILIDTSYKLFLRSGNPKIKMLGIPADFEGSNRYEVVPGTIAHFHRPVLLFLLRAY